MISQALQLIKTDPKAEMISFEVRCAYQELQDLIGKYQPTEILNKIFSEFCIGK